MVGVVCAERDGSSTGCSSSLNERVCLNRDMSGVEWVEKSSSLHDDLRVYE